MGQYLGPVTALWIVACRFRTPGRAGVLCAVGRDGRGVS
jgi:hypothetical protein